MSEWRPEEDWGNPYRHWWNRGKARAFDEGRQSIPNATMMLHVPSDIRLHSMSIDGVTAGTLAFFPDEIACGKTTIGITWAEFPVEDN